MPIFKLSKTSDTFPPSHLASDTGLLAIGGDLNTNRLLNAYANGIFPWYNPGEIIKWYCPNKRFVIFPQKIYISRSMKKLIQKNTLTTKINANFAEVIHNCKQSWDKKTGTWITDEMEEAYINLFNAGHALCVSVYDGKILVGGLYGVAIGKCFFGESMFSIVPNASKLALIKLCQKLTEDGFLFVDCQFHTKHLESMGGQYISWEEYKHLLTINEEIAKGDL